MAWLGHTNEKIFKTVDTAVDIPLNDEHAWKMYPKYNWVYSTSRLLDMQNIEWAPFYKNGLTWAVPEFSMWSNSFSSPLNPATVSALGRRSDGFQYEGCIFMSPIAGEKLTTDIAILKGEIKWASHSRAKEDGTRELLTELRGDVELRISALVTLHFKKFAGVISVDTIGHDIIAARLHLTPELVNQYPEDWLTRVVRIYNRRPWGK